MIVFDSGDGCQNHGSYHTCYKLMRGEVHYIGVGCDFVKIGNCSRKLVCVYELGKIVKTGGIRYYCSSFLSSDVEKGEIYWRGSSYMIDELLQGGINARSLLIAYITLEVVDDMGKTLDFWWKRTESHR